VIGDIQHAPSFVGRKQAHAIASVSTALRYQPERDGDRAGLVAMQSDDAYLFLGVQWRDGKQEVTLRIRENARDPQAGHVISSAPLPAGATGKPVYLKLSIDGGRLGAAYALRKDEWKSLVPTHDATFLSTKLAGGFVGTVLGLYNQKGTP
jgi:alpha-N-arabinofuranosidase